jgi:hypothetical protein
MKRKEQIIFGSHSLRKTSSLDTRRRYNRYSLSYNEKENEEDEDDEDEEDEDDEEDENDDDDNSYSYGKREGIYRRNDITGKSNRMGKGKDRVGVKKITCKRFIDIVIIYSNE